MNRIGRSFQISQTLALSDQKTLTIFFEILVQVNKDVYGIHEHIIRKYIQQKIPFTLR